MKHYGKRLLSLLLALVLVAAGLIQGGAVEAAASGTFSFTVAQDCWRDELYPKKGTTFQAYNFDKPLDASGKRYADCSGNWTLTSLGTYDNVANPSGNLTSIVNGVATAYGVTSADVDVFQLKKDGTDVAKGVIIAQSREVTVFLGDNWNSSGSTYLLSNSALSGSKDITVEKDASTGDFQAPPPAALAHTHAWKAETIGVGSKEAKTVITCTAAGCDLAGQYMEVVLTASDVTLPGNVFNAVINVEELSAGSATLSRAVHSHVSVSQTPGYKYSADGTNYQEIDPATFTPKQGYYQASIMVMDGTAEVENLYVHYTVSDPVVTASTGDDRPIEMMLAGMVTFAAMAAAAFIVDSKRRMVR